MVTVIGLDAGIRMTLIAKFRERGISPAMAEALANKHQDAAKQFFAAELQQRGYGEDSYDQAFAALSVWAKDKQ